MLRICATCDSIWLYYEKQEFNKNMPTAPPKALTAQQHEEKRKYLMTCLEAQGLSMRGFERKYGLSHSAIRRIVKGGKLITHRFAYILAKATDKPLEYWVDFI